MALSRTRIPFTALRLWCDWQSQNEKLFVHVNKRASAGYKSLTVNILGPVRVYLLYCPQFTAHTGNGVTQGRPLRRVPPCHRFTLFAPYLIHTYLLIHLNTNNSQCLAHLAQHHDEGRIRTPTSPRTGC